MNLKLVLRTYSALRQLTDDESALLTTLRNLNDSEREQLVESLAPVKVIAKKTRKPRTKSQRASALESQLKANTEAQRQAKSNDDGDDEDGPRCTYLMGDGAPCNATEHSPVHRRDGGYLKWHEFQPRKSAAAGGGN